MEIWDSSLIKLQEQVYIVYLNGGNRVICWRCVNTGNCSETIFDLKLALSGALGCMACGMIMFHNHPNGILRPSHSDIMISEKLDRAAHLIDIKLIDSMIVTPCSYYSFREHLLLKA